MIVTAAPIGCRRCARCRDPLCACTRYEFGIGRGRRHNPLVRRLCKRGTVACRLRERGAIDRSMEHEPQHGDRDQQPMNATVPDVKRALGQAWKRDARDPF